MALCVGFAVTLAMTGLQGIGTAEDGSPATVLLLMIVTMSLYSLLFAALTHWALTGQPRARMVGTARLVRARKHVRTYRWLSGRSGSSGEVLQLLITAAIAIGLLVTRPEGLPLGALLALTVAAMATAWIGSVMTFAVEYAAEDAHGDAFDLPGGPAHERDLSDYVYGAVLIQASSGASDLVPITSAARRIVRNHVILAHVTSTILLTLAVSALLTTLT